MVAVDPPPAPPPLPHRGLVCCGVGRGVNSVVSLRRRREVRAPSLPGLGVNNPVLNDGPRTEDGVGGTTDEEVEEDAAFVTVAAALRWAKTSAPSLVVHPFPDAPLVFVFFSPPRMPRTTPVTCCTVLFLVGSFMALNVDAHSRRRNRDQPLINDTPRLVLVTASDAMPIHCHSAPVTEWIQTWRTNWGILFMSSS